MSASQKIRIIIADDHKIILEGLSLLLAKEENIQIVAQVLNGNEVLSALAAHEVDIVILDIEMPELNGYDTVIKMKRLHPKTKVIVLSLHDSEKHIGKLLRAGVAGYIVKNRGSEDLVAAINN